MLKRATILLCHATLKRIKLENKKSLSCFKMFNIQLQVILTLTTLNNTSN